MRRMRQETVSISLGDPLFTLAALYLAAEKYPSWVGYRSGKELLIAALGGASSDWLIEQFKNFAGDLGLTDEMIQGIVGALMVKYGDRLHEAVSTMGRGVIFDLAMRSFKEAGMTLGNLLGGFLSQPRSRCRQVAEIELEQPHEHITPPAPRTLEEYIAMKYGIKV